MSPSTTRSPTSTPPAPAIAVSGPSILSVAGTTMVSAEVSAVNYWTDQGVSAQAWSVYWIQGAQYLSLTVPVNGTSLDIPAGTLQASQDYVFTFEIRYGLASVFNASTSISSAAASGLVAAIAGGSFRTVPVGDAFSLDAATSYDPDSPGSSLAFAWSCAERPSFSSSAWGMCTVWSSTPSQAIASVGASVLSVGTEYQFTVDVSSGARNASTSAVVIPVSGQPPTVYISTGHVGEQLPSGTRLLITANARPHASSASRTADLVYSWAHLAGITQTSQLASPSISLETPGGMSPGSNYTFSVNVTDPATQATASARVVVSLVAAPAISAVAVSPSSGSAYTDAFEFRATASGAAPLTYRFSYVNQATGEETLLSPYSSEANVSVVLPPGNFVARVYVQDSLGGVSSINTSVAVVVASALVPSGPLTSCLQTNVSVTEVRSILASSGAQPTNFLGICNAMDAALEELTSSGKMGAALRTATYLQAVIDQIPDTQVPVSSCGTTLRIDGSAPASAAGLIESSSGCPTRNAPSSPRRAAAQSADTYITFQDILITTLDIVSMRTALLVARATASGPSASEQALGLLSSLSGSAAARNAAKSSTDIATNLTSALRALIDDSDPQELLYKSSGASAATTTSNTILLANVSAAYGVQGACGAMNGAVALVDRMLLRAGQAQAPGLGSRAYPTPSFNASTEAFFSDQDNVVASANARVKVPVLSQSLGGLRPSATIALTVFTDEQSANENASSINVCRTQQSFESPVVSVTLSSGISSFAPGENITIELPVAGSETAAFGTGDAGKSCEFWDETRLQWNDTACTFSGYVDGAYRCDCKHLTEFAVLSRDRESDEPPPVRIYFVCGAFLFAVLAALAGVQASRLIRAQEGKSINAIAHYLIIAQAIARVFSCLLLSSWVPSLTTRDASAGVIVVLLALPYTFFFWNYTLVAFQFAAMVNNRNLSRNPFRAVRNLYLGVSASISLAAWALFVTVALAAQDYFARAASYTLAIVCTAVVLAFSWYGRRLAAQLGKSAAMRAHSAKAGDGSGKILKICNLVAVCFVIQSACWVVSVHVVSEAAFEATNIVYLAANLVGALVLLDMYRGGVVVAEENYSMRSSGGSSGRSSGRSRRSGRRGNKKDNHSGRALGASGRSVGARSRSKSPRRGLRERVLARTFNSDKEKTAYVRNMATLTTLSSGTSNVTNATQSTDASSENSRIPMMTLSRTGVRQSATVTSLGGRSRQSTTASGIGGGIRRSAIASGVGGGAITSTLRRATASDDVKVEIHNGPPRVE